MIYVCTSDESQLFIDHFESEGNSNVIMVKLALSEMQSCNTYIFIMDFVELSDIWK